MTEYPLVSILIPAYNAERYIGETLRSVTAQSWPRKEIIVVDDGSTDKTYDIARKFEEDGVFVFRQNNAGAPAARNRAFQLSHGDFIQFFDADDLMSPDKISAQMDILLNAPEGTVSVCRWRRFRVHPGDMPDEELRINRDHADPIDACIHSVSTGECFIGQCFLTPRAVIERAGPWDESLSINQDGEFFMRVQLAAEHLRFSPQSIVYYRSGIPCSISAQYNKKTCRSRFHAIESYEKHILAKENSQRARLALSRNYSEIAWDCCVKAPFLTLRILRKIKELGGTFNTSSKVPEASLLPYIGVYGTLIIRMILRNLQKMANVFPRKPGTAFHGNL